ncbi:histidinol dehydrogenase [Enterococcus sp. AZ103]|uniref:histidinol dehydrogenase n=1 Tax=Enterococcus sp. AZ103 TaxID=2774628 RepID=UPI003F23111A
MRKFDTKKDEYSRILQRQASETADVSQVVTDILADVEKNGDQALFQLTKKIDGIELTALKVSEAEMVEALEKVPEKLLTVLKLAKEKITSFHQKQVRQGFVATDEPGVVMGQRILPLEKVGVYVPGGTASYPSTVLMDTIPAKIAGVAKIVMVTPPNQAGKVEPAILAAAKIAGVDEVYKVGGAQAVAALAYGTETIPQVDKIVGPGNIYVATAKKMVYGKVDIDMIAGPSDVLIVADESGKANWLAADMIAQAEHDTLAQAILVTTDADLAEAVEAEVSKQLAALPRQKIAEASLNQNGKIILVKDLKEAVEIANLVAPEHLELAVKEPFALLSQVKNAGSVFLGHHTPEVLGDYLAGPNHTLPTEGTARFYSPLSVDDFVKKSSYLYYDEAALKEVGAAVAYFAETEDLVGHARSMQLRLEAD